MYCSIHEKIVTFNLTLMGINCMKKNGFKNIQVKIDNGKKHVVDQKCLLYLEEVFYKNINMTPKF